ncbi:hypothetical protein GCM10027566_00510 [Arachidicoccus ginsenosidivorans]|jgi:L-rhamnose mutarotase|uniref:L-rhamnose mutarotase n=1 Tax=Arachidicoccus ginsenosidivorans TaxID=496057 RepID=A0A5B8VRD4_9BACT|nr:L-rhamnose mutarotase [Arachidicoccus ginsenosidivorans]QEC73823.1 L-rhamnose mutarotase [Arachidicoccus ginsenosidivorans]
MKTVIQKGVYGLLLITGLGLMACNQRTNTAKEKSGKDSSAQLTINTSIREGTQATKWEQHVFVVNIVPDSARLAKYLSYHQHIWPEVEAGFKKAGYKEISVSRFKNLLVMTVIIPQGANLDSMSKIAEASNPKCAEWNRLMDQFQRGVSGTAPGQKWVEAKQFYHFENK